MKICNKCQGPIIEENGKYVCINCGTQYGAAAKAVKANYSSFYDTVSLEKFRRISNRLKDTVVLGNFGWGRHEDDRAIYTIAALSNGQFYTRFLPGKGYDSAYRGQCEVEYWRGLERIYSDQEYTVGITHDGQLMPTLTEAESCLARTVGDKRIKQILDMSYSHSYKVMGETGHIEDKFVGLDINGKVVIHNPFEVFLLSKNDPDDVRECTKCLSEIRSWPPIKKLTRACGICGIAEDGSVHITSRYDSLFDKETTRLIKTWTNVEEFYDISYSVGSKNACVALRADGTVISDTEGFEYNSVRFDKLKDIVQLYCHFDDVFYLNRRGELYHNGKLIDKDVVSYVDRGYVKADGSLYEMVKKNPAKYKPIPDFKLFESINTVEEEWAATKAAYDETLNSNKEIDKQCRELELSTRPFKDAEIKERKIYSGLLTERNNLGFFSFKEKSALDARIRESEGKIQHNENERYKIQSKIRSLKSENYWSPPESYWSHFDLPDENELYVQARLGMQQVMALNQPKKSGSGNIIAGAAAGAVIAGPAGAIVGAIYMADKNRKK